MILNLWMQNICHISIFNTAKLIANRGQFEYSKSGWDDFSIADGRLITGQDPTAARSVAKDNSCN